MVSILVMEVPSAVEAAVTSTLGVCRGLISTNCFERFMELSLMRRVLSIPICSESWSEAPAPGIKLGTRHSAVRAPQPELTLNGKHPLTHPLSPADRGAHFFSTEKRLCKISDTRKRFQSESEKMGRNRRSASARRLNFESSSNQHQRPSLSNLVDRSIEQSHLRKLGTIPRACRCISRISWSISRSG